MSSLSASSSSGSDRDESDKESSESSASSDVPRSGRVSSTSATVGIAALEEVELPATALSDAFFCAFPILARVFFGSTLTGTIVPLLCSSIPFKSITEPTLRVRRVTAGVTAGFLPFLLGATFLGTGKVSKSSSSSRSSRSERDESDRGADRSLRRAAGRLLEADGLKAIASSSSCNLRANLASGDVSESYSSSLSPTSSLLRLDFME